MAWAEKQIDTKLFLALCQMGCSFLVPGAPKKRTSAQAVFMALCLDTSLSSLFEGEELCSNNILLASLSVLGLGPTSLRRRSGTCFCPSSPAALIPCSTFHSKFESSLHVPHTWVLTGNHVLSCICTCQDYAEGILNTVSSPGSFPLL